MVRVPESIKYLARNALPTPCSSYMVTKIVVSTGTQFLFLFFFLLAKPLLDKQLNVAYPCPSFPFSSITATL